MTNKEQHRPNNSSEKISVQERIRLHNRLASDLTDRQLLSSTVVYVVSGVGITLSATFIGALLGVNIDARSDPLLNLETPYWFILAAFSFGLILSVFLRILMKMKLQQDVK